MSRGEDICIRCRQREPDERIGRQRLCAECVEILEGESEPEPEQTADSGDLVAPGFTAGQYVEFAEDRYLLGTVVDGRKAPRAPWASDSVIPDDKEYDSLRWDQLVGHNWDGIKTDMDTALDWKRKVPRDWYLAAGLEDPGDKDVPRPILIDIDNCRNPSTGELHPVAAELWERSDTYGQVSYSGTGVHFYIIGTVPEGYGHSAEAELPTWKYEDAAGGPPEIEVYARERFIALTGKHLDGTPQEIGEDSELVADLFERFGTEKSDRPSVDGDDIPGSSYTPTHSPGEVAGVETTDDMDVIFSAIEHTDYGDFSLKSEQTQGGSGGSDRKSFDPCWEDSASGTRLGHEDGWIYRKGNIGLNSLQVVALEEGIISSPEDYPEGDDFWRAVDELRNRGANIPEYEATSRSGSYRDKPLVDRVLLPDLDDSRVGWGIREDRAEGLTQQDVYDQTQTVVQNAMEDGEYVLVDGVMGTGKTYSSFKAAKATGEPIFYAAPRVELYQQGVQYALDVGFDRDEVFQMPALFRDCPSANGELDEDLAGRLAGLRANGVNPKTMHSLLDLPCEDDGECPYREAMKVDLDQYEVVIGHYTHTHLPQLASGRHVIMDEEPVGAYSERLSGDQLITSVNTFLGFDESPPFDDWEDLLANRDDPDRREAAKAWYETYRQQEGWDADEQNAIRHEDRNYHAQTPKAVYGIIFGDRVGDGPYHKTHIQGRNPILFREADESEGYEVVVNTPPSDALSYARSIIGLDGTPTLLPSDHDMTKVWSRAPFWRLALNRDLEVRRVLSDDERRTFLEDVQGLNIVQTTEARKPYSSERAAREYATQPRDFALLEAADQQYRFTPTVFTTRRVEQRYKREAEDAPFDVRDWDHYGALKGSNDYAERRLGVLLGCPHYGDEYIRRRAALLGVDVDPEGKGNDREYGSAVGDAIYRGMQEAQVAQAALRFGRDGNGAHILIHTSAIPDWLPATRDGGVVTTWTQAQRTALEVLGDVGTITARELADHLSVGIRQTRNILHGFADRGLVSRRQDPADGRRYEWTAEEVGDAPIYGETSLPQAALGGDGEEQQSNVSLSLREISATSRLSGSLTAHDVPRERSEQGTADDAPPDQAVSD